MKDSLQIMQGRLKEERLTETQEQMTVKGGQMKRDWRTLFVKRKLERLKCLKLQVGLLTQSGFKNYQIMLHMFILL